MKRNPSLVLAAALTLPALAAADPKGPAPLSFRTDVAPILVKNCLGCHNSKKAESGLNMSTFALLRKGGKTLGELILEPGDPDASSLVEMVGPEGEPRMPYKLPPLKDAEIQTLARWVKDGAKFDGPSETDTLIASLVDPFKLLPRIEVKVPTADAVTALAYSPDGKGLAVAQGKSVLLLDPATGKVQATLADQPGPVTAVRITPDGKTLIAAGGRSAMFGAVSIWDLASKKRIADLRGHTDSILAADLSPDGKILATASYDRLIKLWDVAQGAELRTLKEHTDAVYSVAFAPDGKTLASAGGDRTVKLWDVATGQRRQSLSDATAEVYAVAFDAQGKILLAGGVDRSIRAWRLDEQGAKLARTVIGHNAAILRLVVSPEGATLYSSGEDKAVKAWELPSLEPRYAVSDQPDWPMALALAPNGARLAVGRFDGSLTLLEPKSGQTALALRDAPGAPQPQPAAPAEKPKPELVKNASLNPPSPRGATRGTKVKMTLTGTGVGLANAVVFSDARLAATIVPAEKPDPNRLEVELDIAPDARVGLSRFSVQTPLGMTPSQSFAVSAYPELTEAEPNDEPSQAKVVALPATLLGTIDKPGDVDSFRFTAKAGQPLVFETVARSMGSSLNGTLALLDDSGHVLAEAQGSDRSLDPLLSYQVTRDATLTLRVIDAEYGGGGNHFYRVQVGPTPYVASVFPLGVERGRTATVAVNGLNLSGVTSVPVTAGPAEPGSIIEVPVTLTDGTQPFKSRTVVVAEGPQAVETEPNDDTSKVGATIAVPGGVSGRIERDGDV